MGPSRRPKPQPPLGGQGGTREAEADICRPCQADAWLTRALVVLGGIAIVIPLALPVPLHALAATDGQIQGRVIDRTAPQHPVARQTVRLTIVERGASSDQEAVSNDAGEFRFAALPVGGVRVFVLSADYRGARYASERILLAPNAPSRAIDLSVYEPSADHGALHATVALAVVDVARGAVRVSVVQGFVNRTDRTLVVTSDDPLVFPLPPGAEKVTTLAGWQDPHVAGGRITDAFPLLPGNAQVAYTYGLESRGADVMLPWTFPYGAENVEVLVADAGVGLIAKGLTTRGTVTGPRGRYMHWSGGPVAPRGQVVLRLHGIPPANDSWPGAVAAGLGVVLFGALVMVLWRSRRIPVS